MPRKRNLDDKYGDIPSKKPHMSQDVNTSQQPHSSQQRQSFHQSQLESSIIRSGKLLRIKLINFMCHENLVINFHERINLLVGNNGSGKSAVLAGLVLGLGSNARSTNRSASVKQFIRNGENSATIEIDLMICNNDSFDKTKFNGKKLTIIRTISSNGSSTYRIKNDQGHIIYKNNEQLQKIMLYHNIQVDNPVFVLNQDNARSFLRDLDPGKNYQLFLKATQIELIMDKLNQCIHMFTDYKHRLGCFKKQTELVKNDVLELQTKYEQILSTNEIKKTLQKYQTKKAWAIVSKHENNLEQIKNGIEKTSNEMQEIENMMKNKNAIEREYNSQCRALEEQINDLKKTVNIEDKKLNDIKSDLGKINENLEIEQNNRKNLENKILVLKRSVEKLTQSIAERSELSQVDKMRAENEKQIKEHQNRIKDLEAMIMTTRRDIELLTETKEQYEGQFEDLKRRRQMTIVAKEKLQKEIDSIKMKKKNALSVYGSHMDEILLLIDQAYKSGKFNEMPKGPLGRYIDVVDDKWRPIIEHLLLNCLNLFLVTSKNDRKILDQILRKFPDVKLKILTNPFCHEVYNVQNGMVHPPNGTHLLMNQILCNDPVIINCLIDQLKIETILLIENQDLAMELTKNDVPNNLQKCVVLEPTIEVFPSPLFRVYSLKIRPPRYLEVNVEQRIRHLETEINNNDEKKESYEIQLKEIKDKLVDIYKHEKQMRSTFDKHENSKNKLNANLEELQNVEFANEDEVKILKDELDELKNRINSINHDIEKKHKLCEKLLNDKFNKDKLLKERKLHLKSIEEEMNSLRIKCDKIKNEFNIKLSDIQMNQQKLTYLQAELEEKKKQYKDESNELKILEETALSFGERLTTKKSEKDLTEIIRNLQNKTKQICSIEEDIEDIKALLDDKKLKYEKSTELIKALTITLSLMDKFRNERFKFVKTLKEQMAIRVKFSFDAILPLRNWTGQIDINHQNNEIRISVVPHDKSVENAISGTKSLSGGERSFSTVAFLLSLWSCVNHPFYVLDEYDVFTDQVNRQIMTQLLLHEAKMKPNCQYVLLTPQDMAFVKASEIIKIHKLADTRNTT